MLFTTGGATRRAGRDFLWSSFADLVVRGVGLLAIGPVVLSRRGRELGPQRSEVNEAIPESQRFPHHQFVYPQRHTDVGSAGGHGVRLDRTHRAAMIMTLSHQGSEDEGDVDR